MFANGEQITNKLIFGVHSGREAIEVALPDNALIVVITQ